MGHGHSVEEINKHVKRYLLVFLALLVLTIITVAVSYIHLPLGKAVLVALLVAGTKGTLVAGGKITATSGDETEDFIAGNQNTQNAPRQRSDPRQTVNVEGGNNQWVVAQILDHGSQIRELAYRLDDIPNQFRKLQDDVRKLQDVEIIVRQNEVVVKPVTTSAISIRTLMITLVIALAMIIALVAFLIYWQVTHG